MSEDEINTIARILEMAIKRIIAENAQKDTAQQINGEKT